MADATENQAGEIAYLPPNAPPTNHGHTLAAWVTMIGILAGVFIAAGAVIAAQVWLFWVGVGVIALSLVVGKVLQVLGFGQPSARGTTGGAA
ncbi:MAG: HGxxPAAW family protein [Cellulomonadaceae bacterium]